MTGSDGINWKSHALSEGNSLNDVIYANNLFVAVGDNGTLITSQDGNNWKIYSTNIEKDLHSIAYS